MEVAKKHGTTTLHLRIFGLALAATVLTAIYFFYCAIIPQTPARISRPAAALIPQQPVWQFVVSLPLPIPQSSFTIALLLLATSTLSFVAYGIAIWLVWGQPLKKRLVAFVLSAGVLFLLLSAFALPTYNTDIFNYMLRGRLAAVYHLNPYYHAAASIAADPVAPFANRRYTQQPGGKLPAWMVFNIVLAKLNPRSTARGLMQYRMFFFLISLLNLGLVAAILQKTKPRFVLTGMLVFAWHPILDLFSTSKTDTLMAFYLLLAIYALVSRRKYVDVLFLTLSVFVKLITLPLFALYFLRDLRLQHWRTFAKHCFIALLVAVLIYLPFMRHPALWLQHFGLLAAGGSSAPGILKAIVKAGFALLILGLAFFQNQEQKRLLFSWALLLLYFAMFITHVGMAWYLITLVAVVSVVPDWRLLLLTGAISLPSLLINFWYSTFSKAFAAPAQITIPHFYFCLFLALLLFLVGIAGFLWIKRRRLPATQRT